MMNRTARTRAPLGSRNVNVENGSSNANGNGKSTILPSKKDSRLNSLQRQGSNAGFFHQSTATISTNCHSHKSDCQRRLTLQAPNRRCLGMIAPCNLSLRDWLGTLITTRRRQHGMEIITTIRHRRGAPSAFNNLRGWDMGVESRQPRSSRRRSRL